MSHVSDASDGEETFTLSGRVFFNLVIGRTCLQMFKPYIIL